jgi:S-adenosylmethionine decarboxylase proenzyme
MSKATKETGQASDQDHDPFPSKIRITARFVLVCFASTTLLPFMLGWACRGSLLRIVSRSLPTATTSAGPAVAQQMPQLVLPKGKAMPNAVYTSKHFDTALTTCDSVLLSKAGSPFPIDKTCNEEDQTCRNPEAGPQDAVDDIHQPVGQHLLVDIKNVDESFLNSKERLAEAMVTLVEESGTTMLSYHCHKLEPTGVSCVGVLLESHISFHTWPEAGVITLDMFTCGTVQMLPLLGMIVRVCGVPETPMIEPPLAQWAFKYRGFPSLDRKAEGSDLDRYVLGSTNVHLKEKVAELQTEIQRVEIYDVLSPRSRRYDSFARTSASERSYESLLPDRIMYTDKVMQSRRYGEKEYHEALVHPAMIAHLYPSRVAILGGGDGAALREVLKHRTVQHVTMIEIDRGVVELSRRHLPEWSSCNSISDRSASCFDDRRTDLVYADAVAWFKDKFGADAVARESDRFDVILMDAMYVLLLRMFCIDLRQMLTDFTNGSLPLRVAIKVQTSFSGMRISLLPFRMRCPLEECWWRRSERRAA